MDEAKANKLRTAGLGTMIAGGVISLAGFAATLAFTVRGNRLENKDLLAVDEDYQREDCGRMDSSKCDSILQERTDIRNGIIFSNYYSQLAGAGLAAGLLITMIGGVIYRRGVKGLTNAQTARVRVNPTFGGLSISGRF